VHTSVGFKTDTALRSRSGKRYPVKEPVSEANEGKSTRTVILAFIAKKPMHVPDVDEILLVFAGCADGEFPFVDKLKDPSHGRRRIYRRLLREPPHELVEKVFCSNLEVKRVAAVLDEDIEELEGPY
jgi:hypothetical protein